MIHKIININITAMYQIVEEYYQKMKYREKRERSSNESSKWNLNYVKIEKSYRSLSRTYQQKKKKMLPTNTNPNGKRENSETQPFPS